MVYGNDHLPHYFHVVSPDAESLVAIAGMRVLKGALPAKVETPAMAWAAANRALIAAEWNP